MTYYSSLKVITCGTLNEILNDIRLPKMEYFRTFVSDFLILTSSIRKNMKMFLDMSKIPILLSYHACETGVEYLRIFLAYWSTNP